MTDADRGKPMETCPMCGARFLAVVEAKDGKDACGACPLASGCGLRACPRCGYTLAPRSRILCWIERVRSWARRAGRGGG